VASRVGLRLALLACRGTDTGRQDETNDASDCSKHLLGDCCNLTMIPWARVQRYSCTVPWRIDCLFVTHMIHVRTPAGSPAAGFGMVPDSALTKEKLYRQC
jgi:hypothetical protein